MPNPAGRPRDTAIADDVIERRTHGETFAEIARATGKHRQNVYKIWKRHLAELAAKEAIWREDLAAINAELDAPKWSNLQTAPALDAESFRNVEIPEDRGPDTITERMAERYAEMDTREGEASK